MSGEKEIRAKISEMSQPLINLAKISDLIKYVVPNIGIKNVMGGILEVLIGRWDATANNWDTNPVATLNNGQTCHVRLKDVQEFDSKSGEYLLIRAKDSMVGYTAENYSEYYARYRRVSPPTFPYWQGTTIIQDSALLPKSSTNFFLSPNEQDVVYFFVVG